MRKVLLNVLAGVLVLGAAAASARPLTPAEQRYFAWDARLPQCADDAVLITLKARFEQRESNYWKSGLEILKLEKVRQTGFRENGLDYIPRRYCEARAVISDSKTRTLYFNIGEDLDMNGGDALRSIGQSFMLGLFPEVSLGRPSGWGVDWCVIGLDRNYSYGQNCKAARP